MSEGLKAGDKAPEFELEVDGYVRSPVKLSDFRGKKVVLYFYPKDDTPGCTREACDFRDRLGELTGKGVVVLGVSKDSLESHAKFRKKYDLTFPLLADTAGKVSESYGVIKEKNLYGRKSVGIERTTFLIDGEGVIRKIYPKVKVDGHVGKIEEDLARI
ncbi:thioredoxin-dependent thiol peroxidase [Leptospirillum ferriphilum]|uniref:thioredoxin-dependent peroxiredoxin n=3 Tax=Leptospirillum ferriphilum TaxID=178606 RepID=A0A059XNA9_9BACT|nr:thioredoxin-dependent thiol peroxidase [Leptospirillum ferriphilum]EAY57681.1 MAG: Peroxiredoxin [Leptospirillum rubarum]AFS52631.1 peroxiredoxin [Leptospirillum ferriphilum ML-04]AIA30029.1 alkyl hydroperoxide reductase [Leptospirillum ferriphilum YSK]OOH72725.1 peroxiredoxin [Leptospirillum ferriphilum]OOH79037.1 peroxiredoxin [Leptospirillum ferriphilum]